MRASMNGSSPACSTSVSIRAAVADDDDTVRGILRAYPRLRIAGPLAHLEQHPRDLRRERRLAAAAHRQIADADDRRGEAPPQMGPCAGSSAGALARVGCRGDEATDQWTTRNGRTTPIDPLRSGSSWAITARLLSLAPRLDSTSARAAAPSRARRTGSVSSASSASSSSARVVHLDCRRPA